MDEVGVRGLEQLARLSRDLRAAGDKEMRRELYRAVQRAGQPLKESAQESTRNLPQRGGLAERVRRASYRTKARGGRNPSVTFTAKDSKRRSVDLKALDRGVVRHPVFGTRARWVTQQVRPGWWSEAMDRAVPEVRAGVLAAIDEVARRFYSKR